MSRMPRRIGLAAAAFLLVVSSGCGVERASAPSSVAAPAASQDVVGGLIGTLGPVLKLTSVNGLLRTSPLTEHIAVSRTIGSEGGLLAIPEAGVSVLVPPGALSEPTAITMTARAGSLVAYDFAPHGVTFARPLVFTQRLKGTNASILTVTRLRLAYYSDASLLDQTTAVVSELIGGVSSLLTWTFTAPIKHFSGYLVSCGFQDQ